MKVRLMTLERINNSTNLNITESRFGSKWLVTGTDVHLSTTCDDYCFSTQYHPDLNGKIVECGDKHTGSVRDRYSQMYNTITYYRVAPDLYAFRNQIEEYL